MCPTTRLETVRYMRSNAAFGQRVQCNFPLNANNELVLRTFFCHIKIAKAQAYLFFTFKCTLYVTACRRRWQGQHSKSFYIFEFIAIAFLSHSKQFTCDSASNRTCLMDIRECSMLVWEFFQMISMQRFKDRGIFDKRIRWLCLFS